MFSKFSLKIILIVFVPVFLILLTLTIFLNSSAKPEKATGRSIPQGNCSVEIFNGMKFTNGSITVTAHGLLFEETFDHIKYSPSSKARQLVYQKNEDSTLMIAPIEDFNGVIVGIYATRLEAKNRTIKSIFTHCDGEIYKEFVEVAIKEGIVKDEKEWKELLLNKAP